MVGRGTDLEFCCHMWSLQRIAVFAGCKTITSAVLVHCLRQKTEDELLEITEKMVSAPTLLEKQAPPPWKHGPGLPHFSSPFALDKLPETVSHLPGAVSASGSEWGIFFCLFLLWVSQMLAMTINNKVNNWTMTPHIDQNLPFPVLFSYIFLRN